MKVPNNNYAQQFLAGYQNFNFNPSPKPAANSQPKPPSTFSLAQFEKGSTPVPMPSVSGMSFMA